MSSNIGYHTRLDAQHTVKVVGGSFGGAIDQETIERLVKAHFTVRIKDSGSAVFVDKSNREVSLYFTIDPLKTEAGKEALKVDIARRNDAQKIEDKKLTDIEAIMSGMSTDEILKRLSI